jgi:aspartate racemase
VPPSTNPYTRSIGLIGGLGPLAGATVYQRLVESADAGGDGEHPEVLLLSDPGIPDRQAHLRGQGPTPVPRLAHVAGRLEAVGCGLLLITSVTTHAYLDDIARAVSIPVVDVPGAVADTLRRAGVVRPALAVTTPARSLGILDRALRAGGIEPRYPDDATQAEIQSVVAAVKAGEQLPALAERLEAAITGGWTTGADAVLIGCTDISPLVPHLPRAVHDVAVIMAEAALAAARG